MRIYLAGLLSILLIGTAPSLGWTKSQKKSPAPPPGQVLTQGNGYKIVIENNQALWWPADNRLKATNAAGTQLFQVNLNAAGKKSDGAEAMGLDVEETDLGGQQGGKTYLRGKKQPKGRQLKAGSVSGETDTKEQGKVSQQKVQGIPMTLTEYPNGSYQLSINWGKTREEAFFDRRQTLVSVEQRRKVSGLDYILKQWADGSFMRRYRQAKGEITYTFDAIDQSYRIAFANAKGETVAEAFCRPNCQLE